MFNKVKQFIVFNFNKKFQNKNANKNVLQKIHAFHFPLSGKNLNGKI